MPLRRARVQGLADEHPPPCLSGDAHGRLEGRLPRRSPNSRGQSRQGNVDAMLGNLRETLMGMPPVGAEVRREIKLCVS
jgi:hypothetical protein